MIKFFDFLKTLNTSPTKTNYAHSLHEKLHLALPDAAEDRLVVVACLAGLMARIAYVDFKVTAEEEQHIKIALANWTDFDGKTIDVIAHTAIEEIKELAGIDNHLYVHALKEYFSAPELYKLIEALFALAASDGEVIGLEAEEIRVICKGFDLSNQHYLSARATVLEQLSALKKQP
jgi:uncharacterized tellurite resistance protein B-like protein